MAEIRCPLCGKSNPDELDTCQFCQARLKPLIAPPSAEAAPIQAGDEPVKKVTTELERAALGEGPIHAGEEPTKKNTAELEKALPPWLRSLRAGDSPPAADEPSFPPEQDLPLTALPGGAPSAEKPADLLAGLGAQSADDEEEKLPDWLTGIRGERADADAGVPAAEEPISRPLVEANLLDRLGAAPQEGSTEPQYEIASGNLEVDPGGPAAEGLPDWLQGLQTGAAEPAEAGLGTPFATDGGEDLSQWLEGVPSDQAAAPAAAPASEGIPDWLSKIDEQPPQAEIEVPQTSVAPGISPEAPDWLSKLEEQPLQAGVEQPAPTEMPDWLSDLGGGTETAAAAEPASGAAPDWLSELGGGAETAAAAEPASGAAPDWLSELVGGGETAAAAEPASEAAPDWLTGAGEVPGAAEAGPEVADPSGQAPDWLSRLTTQVAEEGMPGEPAESVPAWLARGEEPPAAAEPGESPDWLKGLTTQAEVPAEASAAPLFAPQAGVSEPEAIPAGFPGEQPVDETPAASGLPVESAPAFVMEEGGAEEQLGGPVFSMDTPDWLSTLKPEDGHPAGTAAGAAVPPESLQPADLPSWVQAMRPVEAVVTAATPAISEEDQETEQQGPLAGLRGVLPAGPGLGALRKPPPYSIKLQVNDTQQRYAAHLENMVSGENKARPVAAGKLDLSGRFLRWLVSLVLGLVVLVVAVSGMQVVPARVVDPGGTLAAFNVVGSLPQGSAVLVVVDYQPAFVGEMEAAAAPLVDQLLYSSHRLTFVSTSSAGPALTEHFVNTTQLAYGLRPGEQYLNLGYLAGGPTGVLSFALDPQAAFPTGVGGSDPWQQPPLLGVDSLDDFVLVVVLTSEADSARAWIEQAGAYLEGTPLVVVASAQAEPLLWPYFDSQQIDGLVIGLAGGSVYEGIIGRPGLAHQYWSAFSIGLLLGVIAILVGMLWSAVGAMRDRQPNVEEEA
ncbi:MAG: hypothetical protein JXB85_01945 [Anaerolineales bacterium]|nr:hypothetical protein [Anaerolineales bacterium]